MKIEVGTGVWEVLEAILARKLPWRLSWPTLADFGQARGGQNGGKMAELGAKMEPRWRQDGPSWAPDRHLEATGGAILAILKGLGADFGKMANM